MFICIEGNIGVGKTTLAKALAKKLKSKLLTERFEDNALLPWFYKEPKKFAFPTEYSFLIDRHKQLISYFNSVQKETITVSDFHFDKCICFAKTNLSASDFKFYVKHFKALQSTVVPPTLIVYLNTSTQLLMNNIRNRGRKIEQTLKTSYIEDLKIAFDLYYSHKKKLQSPVLHINIDEYSETNLSKNCNVIIEKLYSFKK